MPSAVNRDAVVDRCSLQAYVARALALGVVRERGGDVDLVPKARGQILGGRGDVRGSARVLRPVVRGEDDNLHLVELTVYGCAHQSAIAACTSVLPLVTAIDELLPRMFVDVHQLLNSARIGRLDAHSLCSAAPAFRINRRGHRHTRHRKLARVGERAADGFDRRRRGIREVVQRVGSANCSMNSNVGPSSATYPHAFSVSRRPG